MRLTPEELGLFIGSLQKIVKLVITCVQMIICGRMIMNVGIPVASQNRSNIITLYKMCQDSIILQQCV